MRTDSEISDSKLRQIHDEFRETKLDERGRIHLSFGLKSWMSGVPTITEYQLVQLAKHCTMFDEFPSIVKLHDFGYFNMQNKVILWHIGKPRCQTNRQIRVFQEWRMFFLFEYEF